MATQLCLAGVRLRINEMPRLRSEVLASEGPRENSIVIFQVSYGCHEQQDMAANHDSPTMSSWSFLRIDYFSHYSL
jgi:hypothetical protein